MRAAYLGIDLGGSNISAALMTPGGKLLHFEKIETLATQGPRMVMARIIRLTQNLVASANWDWKSIPGVGIGIPGLLDIHQGIVRYSPNLPGWKNIPLRQYLRSALRRPIVIDNDANVAAYGERWLGAGQGQSNLIMYTLGTGVGGGIIVDGKIFHGQCDGAGELGHITILPKGPLCSCGNRGCLEALVSGTAIARRARQALRTHPRSRLQTLCQGQLPKLTAKMVFQAARQGDQVAQLIVEQTGVYLGIAIANIINLLNPGLIVIGGGVSIAGEGLLHSVRREVKRRAMKDLLTCVKIVSAKLLDRAGVYGAVGIAIQAYGKNIRLGRANEHAKG